MREFEYVTTSSNAGETDLLGSVYWYLSTDTTGIGNPIYYELSGFYSMFRDNVNQLFITYKGEEDAGPANYYLLSGSTLSGHGTFTGTLSISANTIFDAWLRAEDAIFDSLLTFTGSELGREAFRGFLPIHGDTGEYKYVNAWMLTSGGSTQFEIERLSGDPGLWCSLRNDVRIESLWKKREDALTFTGTILAWLKQTGNFGQQGNVTWCTLAEIPPEPIEHLTKGHNPQRYWRQSVYLELVYKTETTY